MSMGGKSSAGGSQPNTGQQMFQPQSVAQSFGQNLPTQQPMANQIASIGAGQQGLVSMLGENAIPKGAPPQFAGLQDQSAMAQQFPTLSQNSSFNPWMINPGNPAEGPQPAPGPSIDLTPRFKGGPAATSQPAPQPAPGPSIDLTPRFRGGPAPTPQPAPIAQPIAQPAPSPVPQPAPQPQLRVLPAMPGQPAQATRALTPAPAARPQPMPQPVVRPQPRPVATPQPGLAPVRQVPLAQQRNRAPVRQPINPPLRTAPKPPRR